MAIQILSPEFQSKICIVVLSTLIVCYLYFILLILTFIAPDSLTYSEHKTKLNGFGDKILHADEQMPSSDAATLYAWPRSHVSTAKQSSRSIEK